MAKVHFIGAGQMAEAIIRASLARKTLSADRISIEDIDPARIETVSQTYRLSTAQDAADALAQADLVVIGVRPQDDLSAVAQRINQHAAAHSTIVSIVAGVTLAQLASLLDASRAIARVIPNTLTDTGYGYSGVTLNAHARAENIEDFLSGFGKFLYLEERLLDVFTGFGVAGPNYIYYFIESLTDAGVLAGLPRAQATQVVLENLVGAAEMLKISKKHPRQLLDINNSPAGVGMHGLFELNNSDFAAGLQRSVLAAVKRTTELANVR
ncbi:MULTISPECIES: pyrroline-5-carboxylate reductase [unclassified Brenneria]|uniref:pyrroline-5-carboxylate reductase n=1 Tax=unclassified Brenneria TaxID=2634434 RepID=UPI0015542445|nr:MULTISPECIES: pyrroline-5-carboxylate reductase [unclassified Brenneria]MBJ7220359.1 pyrroline-5-carboxylate reductase [Brenneria sp. L3-3C-1]MEE3641604.1 pyrroline-5-carboxylate reductase [Brenneria sp. L3_3C_1]MEE3649765.1 pyrroline-5-carboxylate reductase [Brenneria sp. HEZEL_4_2_4]NPC99724.1 pyrroline-5-carboxylate reductase [Brenneria sp. hezel4-2-4]